MDHLDSTRNDHKDFLKGSLEQFLPNPLLMFQKWYQTAFEKNCPSPHAMVISTVSAIGQPSSRVVYMKEVLEEGLVFYSNYKSKKGRDLESNPHISALFFWEVTEQQVRLEGKVIKIAPEMSDAYFASRPRISQIGAWASHQSETIQNRAALELLVEEFEAKYPNEVPRPPHWGGYLIEPHYFEFWQGRLGRLHDRICYVRKGEDWEIKRIAP
ncbi:pyridoxamine 5'-phosphate oxidase [Putridiphycobacter roseus]|uniref:Pyridoxine/pyridoxamine 5'-phosphate oxidase n=1 Tax=Putridiphycobacter roseus TaxID=2219161 RepID=A0A2W1N119_9FLAO|nr:pyridoxamine 5'-phosphate oxidase [Putridiphycobacter roseus]PZE17240.1 pyridoxamine 5'-phosphate oxidase [Putridiphycobacter roseus]